MDGHDVELTMQVPYLPWARVRARRYWWNTVDASEDIKGWAASTELDLLQNLQIEAGVKSDNFMTDRDENEGFVMARFHLSLGRPVAASNQFVTKEPWMMRDMTAYEATVYQVTVKQVELCSDAACSSTIILGTNDTVFDIASSNVGQQVGSYANATGIAAGSSFTHVKVTVDETITMRGGGSDNTNGNNRTCYTDTTPAQNGDANTVEINNNGAASGEDEAYIIPSDAGDFAASLTDSDWTSLNIAIRNTNADSAGDVVITYPLTAPYTSNGQEPLIEVQFDTSSALGVLDLGAGCVIFPRPPTVTISITNP